MRGAECNASLSLLHYELGERAEGKRLHEAVRLGGGWGGDACSRAGPGRG